jgi:uncharacterized protein YdeI (YjbR/CyaY-like superfamily)
LWAAGRRVFQAILSLHKQIKLFQIQKLVGRLCERAPLGFTLSDMKKTRGRKTKVQKFINYLITASFNIA